jgi:hypothetical protein
MSWSFGNAFTRLIWGGVRLRDSEMKLLELAVHELPVEIRQTVDAQLAAYRLAQREADGRAINFYLKGGKQSNDMEGVAPLPTKVDDAPLVKITAKFEGDAEPVHAVLTAVGNRVFCISFSRALTLKDDASRASIVRSVASWRSNVQVGAPR